MTDVRLAVGAATDPGLRRAVNEDSLLARSPGFVVADGMGGHDAGDLASATVVAAFRDHLPESGFADVSHVRDALREADARVGALSAGTLRGAGSTVAAAILVRHDDAPHWLVVNVGDSRVYRFAHGRLEQLTVDHSLGGHVITRAIGAADSLADSWMLPVVAGERLLVCSDGVHSEVDDDVIRAVLEGAPDPEDAAHALVDEAKRRGGRDNITALVVDVVASPATTLVDDLDDTLPARR